LVRLCVEVLQLEDCRVAHRGRQRVEPLRSAELCNRHLFRATPAAYLPSLQGLRGEMRFMEHSAYFSQTETLFSNFLYSFLCLYFKYENKLRYIELFFAKCLFD